MEPSLPEFSPVEIDYLECIQSIEDPDFLSRAEGCAVRAPSAVLLSGGELRPHGENRYSIAAWEPLAVLRCKGGRCRVEAAGGFSSVVSSVTLDAAGGVSSGFSSEVSSVTIEADPLEVLDRLCAGLAPSFGLDVPPFSGGALGYLAYDLKNMIERLPATARDDLGLPDIFLFWPRNILVHDRKERRLYELGLKFRGEPHSPPARPPRAPLAAESRSHSGPLRTGPLRSNFTHGDYLAAISKIRTYIRRGDVYQVNLSQRFHFALEGDPFRLWRALFEMNPAPFYAYINAGDHRILSTSMERFLFRQGAFIETRPIKGTRKRGKTPVEDAALAAELLQSPKDDAELSMIVDLLRNDLGRICLPRTIRVTEHKRLETYQNVHHLVSIVTGELDPGITPAGIVRATFPGGSVTGCPKIRSMEIIDELEPNVRHVYTGAIGYLGWHDNLDLNVAIRTAIVKGKTCYFSVGGGIVHDSVEEDEYQETLHKGRTLFELMEKLGGAA
ncbi:MAG: aminodeoxychorismate synthase component I [Syntrophobacteraceae bacterium]